jgi:hypothetical protein
MLDATSIFQHWKAIGGNLEARDALSAHAGAIFN